VEEIGSAAHTVAIRGGTHEDVPRARERGGNALAVKKRETMEHSTEDSLTSQSGRGKKRKKKLTLRAEGLFSARSHAPSGAHCSKRGWTSTHAPGWRSTASTGITAGGDVPSSWASVARARNLVRMFAFCQNCNEVGKECLNLKRKEDKQTSTAEPKGYVMVRRTTACEEPGIVTRV
jgi:hypothetical protein